MSSDAAARKPMRLRLRTRVAISFAVLSLVVAGVVSTVTYVFARSYLLSQRETSALTRALLDSRAAATYLSFGTDPTEALAQVPVVGTSLPMVFVNNVWYTTAADVPPDALPPGLADAAVPNGAQQVFSYNGAPYFAVAVPMEGNGTYVEVFAMDDLDATLRGGAWVLAGLCVVVAATGALIGVTAVGRILGPLRRIGVGARRITSGELNTRIELTGDPDLDPIATSFNEMAKAVRQRIARERRFSANVSHELRSPLTSVLGTAELLENARDRLPEREASIVVVLVGQVRRMSRMLLDLLEISRITADEPTQWESADIAALCRAVLSDVGVDPALVTGDAPTVRTDARRFERIVRNLVENAQRHGDGLREVTVRALPGQLELYVDDAGQGIDEAVQERLFEPFARGVGVNGPDGAGLGLAIVREQAAALGGEVTVETSPQGGARFVVRLPVAEGGSTR